MQKDACAKRPVTAVSALGRPLRPKTSPNQPEPAKGHQHGAGGHPLQEVLRQSPLLQGQRRRADERDRQAGR